MRAALPDSDSAKDVKGVLRITILGWLIGRGSTGVYGAEFADYLSRSGHSVTCVSAGVCDWRLKPYIATKRSGGFECVELRNPPVMACTRPANPGDEIDSPETQRLLAEILARARPDIVLILDFPGWPARTVEMCRAAGSKVAIFLQNFWPFCTRLSLLDRWGGVCRDYEDGERCVECMGNIIGSDAARWRARLPEVLFRTASLHASLKRLYRAGAEARSAAAASCGPAYAARRMAYAKAIAGADLVCGISRRTLEVAAGFGASCPNRMVVPIVLTHIQSIRRARPSRADQPDHPLRFGFLGAHAPEKGIEHLVTAFRGIPRSAATLHCFGGGSASYLKHLADMSDEENPPAFHGRYSQVELPALLAGIDVGVVPSKCEDTRPNTVLEFHAAGIPVIGSRIGGIPEEIDDGRNGLLFEPGDASSLRQVLDTIIRSPELICTWRAHVPSDFDSEVSWRELERAFRSL